MFFLQKLFKPFLVNESGKGKTLCFLNFPCPQEGVRLGYGVPSPVNKGNEKEIFIFLYTWFKTFWLLRFWGEAYKTGTQGYWEKCIHPGIKEESKTIKVKERRSQEGETLVCDYDIVFKTQGEAKYVTLRVLTGSAGNKMDTHHHFTH